jgi:hypothetical protein
LQSCLKKKWLANFRLLDVEGNLLVSIYVHSIFPPSPLCLALPLIMPCTLVHLSILKINSAYKVWPLAFQIYKLDGFIKKIPHLDMAL